MLSGLVARLGMLSNWIWGFGGVLHYLRRFSADALKNDISVVPKMLESHHDWSIIQIITPLLRPLIRLAAPVRGEQLCL